MRTLISRVHLAAFIAFFVSFLSLAAAPTWQFTSVDVQADAWKFGEPAAKITLSADYANLPTGEVVLAFIFLNPDGSYHQIKKDGRVAGEPCIWRKVGLERRSGSLTDYCIVLDYAYDLRLDNPGEEVQFQVKAYDAKGTLLDESPFSTFCKPWDGPDFAEMALTEEQIADSCALFPGSGEFEADSSAYADALDEYPADSCSDEPDVCVDSGLAPWRIEMRAVNIDPDAHYGGKRQLKTHFLAHTEGLAGCRLKVRMFLLKEDGSSVQITAPDEYLRDSDDTCNGYPCYSYTFDIPSDDYDLERSVGPLYSTFSLPIGFGSYALRLACYQSDDTFLFGEEYPFNTAIFPTIDVSGVRIDPNAVADGQQHLKVSINARIHELSGHKMKVCMAFKRPDGTALALRNPDEYHGGVPCYTWSYDIADYDSQFSRSIGPYLDAVSFLPGTHSYNLALSFYASDGTLMHSELYPFSVTGPQQVAQRPRQSTSAAPANPVPMTTTSVLNSILNPANYHFNFDFSDAIRNGFSNPVNGGGYNNGGNYNNNGGGYNNGGSTRAQKPEKCGLCLGNGRCLKCNGTRTVTNPYTGKYQKCTYCNGTGICHHCHGTGQCTCSPTTQQQRGCGMTRFRNMYN